MGDRFYEYCVIGAYLVMLFAIALVFRSFNKNSADFFKGGGRTKWWLVGSSLFMASFSAWTFTGAAGVAYRFGWSVAVIFIANAVGFLVNFIYFAPRFRQMRCVTVPEVIRMRFGELVRQFFALLSVLVMPFGAALVLVGLSVFISAVFGYNPGVLVIVLGTAVVFYSMLGGSWAVMAADFMQSAILLPTTLLIAVLCVMDAGGFSGILRAIDAQNLTEQFAVFKGAGEWSMDFGRTAGFALGSPSNCEAGNFIDYTIFWALGMFSLVIVQTNSLSTSVRYFAVKDGREARKAAALAGAMMLFGSVIWFIPPIVARLFHPELVESSGIGNSFETSYAVMGKLLLPKGMTGLMVVAMFAATISSMDVGLNWTAGIITNDIYPGICRLLRTRPVGGAKLLLLGRVSTLALGAGVVGMALLALRVDNFSLFGMMQILNAYIFVPLAVPMFLGLVIKRSPWWSSLVSLAAVVLAVMAGNGVIPGIAKMNQQLMVFAEIAFGTIAFAATMPWWRSAKPEYRQAVENFFARMNRPVDFDREVGGANDTRQMITMGTFAAVVGGFILLLMLVPGNDWTLSGRGGILSVGLTALAIGLALLWGGLRKRRG
ncbi:MAG: hypothetical protein AB7F40_00590 [Victivallaceae bacterium]|nr:hypothetical protein [Victivallaceae bacterium]